MSTIDTQKVWETLMKDPKFTAGMPAGAHAPLRELVDALPTVLAPHFGKKVGVKSLMESALATVEHELESGFIDKVMAAVPADSLPFAAAEMAEMVKDALKMLRTPLHETIHDPEAFLAMQGIDERTFLGHAKGGRLDARNLAAYDAGTLTIRDLFETQPVLFVQLGQDG